MYDAIVVGSGIAGLSAALMLGRARRSVLVLDGGLPRNLPAEHAHGFLSRDGIPPLELLRAGKEELKAYPNVQIMAGEAADAVAQARGFSVTLSDGQTLEARKLILASGVVDVLPSIPGVVELWGNGVYHCPYCHGWEVSDKSWAILGDGPMLFDRVALFRGWASELVVLANGASSLPADEKARLAALGVTLDERRIARMAHVGNDGDVIVSFDDGSSLTVGAVFAMPPQVQRSSLPQALGCELDLFAPTGSPYVKIDAVSAETTVAGVYAAGDMVGPQQNLVFASAGGARAAIRLNQTLAMEDAAAAIAEASLSAAWR